MKLLNFAVSNFRCISGDLSDNKINLNNSNIIFLFGQNNVGKSTFLKAYEAFYMDSSLTDEDHYLQNPENQIIMELEIQLNQDDLEILKTVTDKADYFIKTYLNENNIFKLRKSWGNFAEASTGKGKKQAIRKKNQTYNPFNKEWDDTDYGGIGLPSISRYILPTPLFIKAMPSEEETNDLVNEILSIRADEYFSGKDKKELEDAKAVLQKLQDRMYSPEKIQKYKTKVNEHFNKMFKNIDIDLESKDKIKYTTNSLGKTFEVKFNNKDKDNKIIENIPNRYNMIGHGAIRVAIFTLLLMRDMAEINPEKESNKKYLVLFEEPELFLHPSLIKVLRGLIYEVSSSNYPFQIICASHSPQMIDVTKPKSSLVRMVRNDEICKLYQVEEEFLENPINKDKIREELFESIRFNPFICESFYSDEVILVEGDSEAVFIRAYFQYKEPSKDIFVVNCGTVNNIPFFQRIFSKFNIKYHVLCDTDNNWNGKWGDFGAPVLIKGIQKSIYDQYILDANKGNYYSGFLLIHKEYFEDAHRQINVSKYKYPYGDTDIKRDGKPYCANQYWKNFIEPYLSNVDINIVPIINNIEKIIK